MTAVHAEYHDWESAAAYKLLCDQREQYIEHSKRTRNGVVAPFPQPSPSPNPNSKSAGRRLLSLKDRA